MKQATRLTAIAFAALAISTTQATAEGDADAGEKFFNSSRGCKNCHTVAEGGAKKVGPNLWGIVGSTAGARDTGFKYSKAMVESGTVWTEENLDEFLASPAKFIKGNRMPFGGLRKEEDRANVVAYLVSATQ